MKNFKEIVLDLNENKSMSLAKAKGILKGMIMIVNSEKTIAKSVISDFELAVKRVLEEL